MLVTNLQSPRTGRPVANQYCIYNNGKKIFQSYNSIICVIDDEGEISIAHNAWLSRTTKKYLAVFLEISNKELNKLLPTLKTF